MLVVGPATFAKPPTIIELSPCAWLLSPPITTDLPEMALFFFPLKTTEPSPEGQLFPSTSTENIESP